MHHDSADWYDTPLYYDIIFDADTGREADFIESVMRRHGGENLPKKARILEPACGSGRMMVELARRGHEVSGFDLNPRMLEYAQERMRRDKINALLWEDRLEDFRVKPRSKFDLAHCLVSTFKYVLDKEGAESHLRRVADGLRPGGLYVLGLHLTDYASTKVEHERWSAARDGISVVCNTRTWPADRVARTEPLRTRLTITRGGKTWTQETRWLFRTYDARQLKMLLKSAPGLKLEACYDFTWDIDAPRKLDDSYADVVLVLRRI